jgi:DNA-nicking Smr family endonuclease
MGRVRDQEDGDDALFLAEVADGHPLGDRARIKPPVAAGRARGAPEPRFERDLEAGTGRRVGVTDRELAGLAAGRPPPEVSIDLHGRSEDEATADLDRFLAAARASRRRCVLVVTGKGLHSTGGAVLRHAIPSLLGSRLAHHVRAFAPARPRDGGDGALYVLLAPGGAAHR